MKALKKIMRRQEKRRKREIAKANEIRRKYNQQAQAQAQAPSQAPSPAEPTKNESTKTSKTSEKDANETHPNNNQKESKTTTHFTPSPKPASNPHQNCNREQLDQDQNCNSDRTHPTQRRRTYPTQRTRKKGTPKGRNLHEALHRRQILAEIFEPMPALQHARKASESQLIRWIETRIKTLQQQNHKIATLKADDLLLDAERTMDAARAIRPKAFIKYSKRTGTWIANKNAIQQELYQQTKNPLIHH